MLSRSAPSDTKKMRSGDFIHRGFNMAHKQSRRNTIPRPGLKKRHGWRCPSYQPGSNHDGRSLCLTCWCCAAHCTCAEPRHQSLAPRPARAPAEDASQSPPLPMRIVPLDKAAAVAAWQGRKFWT